MVGAKMHYADGFKSARHSFSSGADTPSYTMHEQKEVLIISDEIPCDAACEVRDLLKSSKRSPILEAFFFRLVGAINSELARNVSAGRCGSVPFTDLGEVVRVAAQDMSLAHTLDAIVLYSIRIGNLLLSLEQYPDLLVEAACKLCVCGSGFGQFVAIVLAASRSALDVCSVAISLVPVIIHTSEALRARAISIYPGSGAWGYEVTGSTQQEMENEIARYHDVVSVPSHSRCYISSVIGDRIQVSGPPPVLDQLFIKSAFFAKLARRSVRTASAIHAPHLMALDTDLVAQLVDHLTIFRPVDVLCSSSGHVLEYANLAELLSKIIHGLGSAMLDINAMTRTVVERVSLGSPQTIVLGQGPFGTTLSRDVPASGPNSPIDRRSSIDMGAFNDNAIAIIGVAGRFPGGDDLEDFWRVIREAKDEHEEIPPSRFDINAFYDAEGKAKNSTRMRHGCFLKSPGLFDAHFFGVSPREARQLDPTHRLLLTVAYEALEMAGYSDFATSSIRPERVGSFMAQVLDDWRDMTYAQGVDIYAVPGMTRAFAAGRLNYAFGFGGPYYTLDTACSGSGSAIHLACKALLEGEIDMALAGGGNVIQTPFTYLALDRGGFGSRTGGCKTFRADADGYCRGEGVGVVVLKRLKDAIANNDDIQAVVRGTARNTSVDQPNITFPDSTAQQRLYGQVLRTAGAEPGDITYAELHGTGTQAGDSVEMDSIMTAFSKGHSKANPLYLGAVKANTGHSEAAAAIASVVKSILMIRKGTIPPQVGMSEPLNPLFPSLEAANVIIPTKEIPFAGLCVVQDPMIMVNTFDAAGGNTALVIGAGPQKALTPRHIDPRSHHVVTISARNAVSLRRNKEQLLRFLLDEPETLLSDLAYTTTARRKHWNYRQAYAAASIGNLVKLIEEDLMDVTPATQSTAKPSCVFLCTGQGSAYPGMASELFATSRVFRDAIQQCQRVATSLGFSDFVHSVILGTSQSTHTASQTQLAIVAIEIAMSKLWLDVNVRPDYILGHSLGEYAALHIAGVLSLHDTLYLVGHRALLLEEFCEVYSFDMLAIACSKHDFERIFDRDHFPQCRIACINGPKALVVSGPVEETELLQTYLRSQRLRSKKIEVPYGYHSKQMEPILDSLRALATQVTFSEPSIPIASSLLGEVITTNDVFRASYIVRHTAEPVNFEAAVRALESLQVLSTKAVCIELGPSPVCAGLIRNSLNPASPQMLASLDVHTVNAPWETLSKSLAAGYMKGLSIDWSQLHSEFVSSLSMVQIPHYAFDFKDYWTPFTGLQLPSSQGDAGVNSLPTQPKHKTTSTVQRIVSKETQNEGVKMAFETNLRDPVLQDLINGHNLDGYALCPLSVYVDMALTAAVHCADFAGHEVSLTDLRVQDLDLTHPIIVNSKGRDRTLRIEAQTSKSSAAPIRISYSGTDEQGQPIAHGTCQVAFAKKPQWIDMIDHDLASTQARIGDLQDPAQSSQVYRLSKKLAYMTFANVVSYGRNFQNMEEVYVNPQRKTACAKSSLRDTPGNFLQNPYWVDAITQVSGLILNGDFDDQTDDDSVYLCTGLEQVSVFEQLCSGNTYSTFADFPGLANGTLTGTITVLSSDKVVAICTGVKFQKMPRKILRVILSKADTEQNGGAVTTRASSEDPSSRSSSRRPGNSSSTDGRSIGTPDTFDDNQQSIAERVLDVIAEEAGADIRTYGSEATFDELGIDSMLIVGIVHEIKEKIGLQLAVSFLRQHPTAAEVRKALAPEEKTSDDEESGKEVVAAKKDNFTSHAVLIQGRPDSKLDPLFLVPDGFGSVSCFIDIPQLSSQRPIYGLSCPFLSDPSAFTTIESQANPMIQAIRKTKPKGPYLIGGYSAGAITAYEISRQLINQGETVSHFISIDMRVPKPHPTITPEESARHAKVAFGQGSFQVLPDHLQGKNFEISASQHTHLNQTMLSMARYIATPIPSSKKPLRAHAIWATRGLLEDQPVDFKLPSGEDYPEMVEVFGQTKPDGTKYRCLEDPESGWFAWFYEAREGFGANGWDGIVPGLEGVTVEGNHFSIMARPKATLLAQCLEKLLQDDK